MSMLANAVASIRLGVVDVDWDRPVTLTKLRNDVEL